MSLPLSKQLRKRLEKFAKSKELALASAARMLLEERLTQLEDEVQLTRSEAWQRAQVWGTWERVQAGEIPVMPLAEFRERLERKRARRR